MTANYVQAAADHVIDLFEEAGRPIALIEVIPKPSHLLIENVRPARSARQRHWGLASQAR
jgi:hypothetical protein